MWHGSPCLQRADGPARTRAVRSGGGQRLPPPAAGFPRSGCGADVPKANGGAVFAPVLMPVASRRTIWPWRVLSIESARMRIASWGAWKPVEFSASMKSSRNCAAPLQGAGGRELLVGGAGRLGRLDVVDERDERVHREVAHLEGAVLDRVDAVAQLVLGPLVAGLAGAVDVEQRAAHVVIADLLAPSRLYGMWQSAQVTPERAWMPWFHISNSGCCALSVGAPVSACVQSLKPFSS